MVVFPALSSPTMITLCSADQRAKHVEKTDGPRALSSESCRFLAAVGKATISNAKWVAWPMWAKINFMHMRSKAIGKLPMGTSKWHVVKPPLTPPHTHTTPTLLPNNNHVLYFHIFVPARSSWASWWRATETVKSKLSFETHSNSDMLQGFILYTCSRVFKKYIYF